MTKITAMLPLDMIKGTIKQRYSKIQAANDNLFNRLMKEPNEFSLKRVNELMADTFEPECGRKLNVEVLPLERSDATGMTQTFFENGAPAGYKVFVPSNPDGTVKKEHLGHLMHEATHVHQQLFEPKILSRISSLDLTDKEEKRIANFYQDVLNTQHQFEFFNVLSAKIRLKLALRGLDDTEKLKVMGLMKDNLRMEELANYECERYQHKFNMAGIKQTFNGYADEFLFDEKIEFMEHEIAKHIKKMRKK